MNKKKILFISPFYPDNNKSPRHRAIFNHTQYFLKKNYDITFIYLSNKDVKLNLDFEFIRLDLPSMIEVLRNIFFNIIFLRKISLQNCLFYSSSISSYLKKINSNKKYDLIFFESIRTVTYHKIFDSSYKILDLGDLISRRYKLLRKSNIQVNNVLGQFSRNNLILDIILNNYLIQKIVLFVEEKLVSNMEIKSTKSFDSIILVSKYEHSFLSKYSNKNNIHWIPNINSSKSITNPHFTPNKSIVFYGILDNPHNEHALIYFFKNIFDQILKIDENIQFKIVGKNPTKKIIQYANQFSDNVSLEGYVENIEKFVKKSNLLILPIMAGSGVKTKVLDCINWGVPIVSSLEGVSGMINIEESGILISKDIDDFVKKSLKIINNKSFAENCTKKSFNYYKKYYSNDSIESNYDSMLILDNEL